MGEAAAGGSAGTVPNQDEGMGQILTHRVYQLREWGLIRRCVITWFQARWAANLPSHEPHHAITAGGGWKSFSPRGKLVRHQYSAACEAQKKRHESHEATSLFSAMGTTGSRSSASTSTDTLRIIASKARIRWHSFSVRVSTPSTPLNTPDLTRTFSPVRR